MTAKEQRDREDSLSFFFDGNTLIHSDLSAFPDGVHIDGTDLLFLPFDTNIMI